MEAIMSFYEKPKGKEGEALLEKDIQAWDSYMFNNEELLTSEHLDNEKAIAWGSYMGILLGDFEAIICNYSNKTGRKYFFAYNNFGQPTCFFDVESNKELQAQWEKERLELRKLHGLGKVEQTSVFPNPRKPN